MVQYAAFVPSLPFTSFHSLSLLLLFLLLSYSSLHAQCGVKVKSGDREAYDRAVSHFEKRQYHEASQLLRRVAQRNPKAADPQFWLGMVAVKNGFNTTGVRKYFTKCIELCPNYPNALAHYYMGMILYTDEHYEEATAELESYFAIANKSDDAAQTAVYEEASAYLHWSRFLAEAELNRVPFDPHRLVGVSSKNNETLPYITADGRRCYFLREMAVKKPPTFYQRTLEEKQWRLYCSEWKDSAFSKGVELPAPFNQGAPEGSVSVTADGCTLYFSRIEMVGGYANSDLYCAVWNAESRKWKERKLGDIINGERSWESQPSITADGNILYFASNRKGGLGGTDIWRCHRLKNGDWSRPTNLGSSINTTGNEKFPFIHADGHTLYFLSDGWQGFGGYDVYFSDMDDASGTHPTNLGLPINTEDNEMSFSVVADGTRAYYPGRTEASRSGDILVFDLYPAARPEAMRHHVLVVTDSLGRTLPASAATRNGSWKAPQGTLTLMLSEKYDDVLTVTADSLMPAVIALPASEVRHGKVPGKVVLQPCGAGTTARLDVSFLSGSRLTPTAERVLDAWAAWLFEHPRIHVEVGCRKVTEAKAVYDYLIKKKLRAERLSYRGGTDIKYNQLKMI